MKVDMMFIILSVWTCIFVALVMWACFFMGLLVIGILLIGYKWSWIQKCYEKYKNYTEIPFY